MHTIPVDVDMDGAIERMGSRELFLSIAQSFAAMMPETLADIASAMKAKNWPEARRLAHSLKSNCAAMGAEATRERVYALEKACSDADETLAATLYAPLCEELASLRETFLAL